MSADSQNTVPAPAATESRPSVGSNNQEYPEQKHAGAVGYGPNFKSGPGLGDKMDGIKEEIKGTITRNHDLVQHGKELKSGALKEKELNDDSGNPFKAEQAEQQKASTVAPEGTHEAGQQAKANNGASDKVIDAK